MKKKLVGLVTLATVAALTLAACGGTKDEGSKDKGKDKDKTEQTDLSKFTTKQENDNKAIEGGTLEVALVTESPFRGLFHTQFYEDNYDARIMDFSHEGLFSSDLDFVITDDGLATVDLDQDKKTATIKIKDGVKWSDGEDLKAEDVIFSYEVIGHKDYKGVRYDENFMNINGIEAYHNGKADTISGIKAIDDKTVEISYKEVHPGMLQVGGGIYASALPKHDFKGVSVLDMPESDQVRVKPVTLGPYYMNKIKPGESVEFLPNEHYYKGKQKLDKVVVTAVPSASIVEALKTKKYDIALAMPTDIYDTYKELDGYQMLGRPEQSYTYIGFKMGKWNDETGSVEYNPESKMANKSLRQAMGYAADNDAIGEKFYHGLRSNATTLIPPVFGTFHDSSIEGYTQDLEKAEKILEDAGYKDTDGDGLREDPNGEKLVIKFASMAGGEVAQPLADYYVQNWKKIGLNVELATGRLIEFNSFYDKLKADDAEIDVYQGAWGTGSDPSPTGLYGPNSAYNYPRFESEENTKLLKAIDSNDSFDQEKRVTAFKEWQKYASEEAFVIPTLYRNEILPVSNRVKNLDWTFLNQYAPYVGVELTAEER